MRATIVFAILALALTACGTSAPAPAPPPTQAPAAAPKPAATSAPAAPAPAPTQAQAAAPKPAATSPAPATAQFVYRLGHTAADATKNSNGALGEAFKREVEKNSNGRIRVDIFGNAQLGGELELVNAVKTGQLDLYAGSSPPVATLSPSLQLSELPFFYSSIDLARKVLDGEAGQMALKTLEPQGVKGLGWGELGFRALLNSKKAVNTLDDVKGMKIRVVENPLYVSTWRAVGANPVPMSWTEVYTALQQKTIDGVDTNLGGMLDAKHYEVAKQLALTNHSYTANVLLFNLAKFNALPDDLKKAVQDASVVASAESRRVSKTVDDGAVDTMKKQSVSVTSPPREPFVAAMKSVYDEFVPKIGADIVAKAQAAGAGR